MVCKESDGKHFAIPKDHDTIALLYNKVGIALITKRVSVISATRWKIVMIGECFGNRGKNGRTVSSS